MSGCFKPDYENAYSSAEAVLADIENCVGIVEQRLYKLEGGKLKWRGVKSVTPVLNSTEGLGPSFGGAFDSRAAAISSPSSFYTLYRQGCWVPEGANHCVYTGNVYEEVTIVTMISCLSSKGYWHPCTVQYIALCRILYRASIGLVLGLGLRHDGHFVIA